MTDLQTPTAACAPVAVLSGPADCLDGDCDEYATEDGEPTGIAHCSHVTEQQVCGTHSEFTPDEWEYCTRAEPWPHLTAAAPSTVES